MPVHNQRPHGYQATMPYAISATNFAWATVDHPWIAVAGGLLALAAATSVMAWQRKQDAPGKPQARHAQHAEPRQAALR